MGGGLKLGARFVSLDLGMDEELRERLCAAAERIFSGGGILVAYAFGSRVSGRPADDSDLDVGTISRDIGEASFSRFVRRWS